MRKKKDKYALVPLDGIFQLPALREVNALLPDKETSLVNIIDEIKKHPEIPCSISKSTLKNAVNGKGITKKSLDCIQETFLNAAEINSNFVFSLAKNEDGYERSSYLDWLLLAARGREANWVKGLPENVYFFIHERAEACGKFVRWRNRAEYGVTTTDAQMMSSLRDSSFLCDQEISDFISFTHKYRKHKLKEATEPELLSYEKLKLDFYLSLIAATDAPLNDTFSRPSDRPSGHFSEILRKEGGCYFARYLNYLCSLRGEASSSIIPHMPVRSCAIKEMQEYDDLTDTQQQSFIEKDLEAKKNRLKEWKKGKTKPGEELVHKVTASYLGIKNQNLAALGVFCLMFDRMKKQHSFNRWDEIVTPEHYERYYRTQSTK